MEYRPYGSSGLSLPVLGFGAGLIGDPAMDENYVGYFINQIVDSGISFIDTARGYGLSEERIGRHLSWRRNDFLLSTKVGYGIPGYQDWTYDCIVAGVHHALRTMRTDRIDIVHLHSCPLEILERGEVTEALERMVHEGHVRIAAYSGENDALRYAERGGRFTGLMCSVNVFDQRSLDEVIAPAAHRGAGVIAKRPIGNAPWNHHSRPHGQYCEEYWHRMRTMELDFGDSWLETALRFTAFAPGVACSIVGTANLEHLRKNIDIVGKGALPEETVSTIRQAFRVHDHQWTGQI